MRFFSLFCSPFDFLHFDVVVVVVRRPAIAIDASGAEEETSTPVEHRVEFVVDPFEKEQKRGDCRRVDGPRRRRRAARLEDDALRRCVCVCFSLPGRARAGSRGETATGRGEKHL